MRYKITKKHDKLKMADGVKGHYLFDVDGKRVMVERILTISLTKDDDGYYGVIATLRDSKKVELFSHKNYEFTLKELKRYRKEFEYLKGMI